MSTLIVERQEGVFLVRWEGGHTLHLFEACSIDGESEGCMSYEARTELAVRTVGDMTDWSLTVDQAVAEVDEWADWIASGDPAAMDF